MLKCDAEIFRKFLGAVLRTYKSCIDYASLFFIMGGNLAFPKYILGVSVFIDFII